MQPPRAVSLGLAAFVLAFAATSASAASASAKVAAAWLRDHPAAQGDELAELKGENPEAYAIVKALLTKRSLGLLDPRHPTASFAAPPPQQGQEASGAAAFARFADAPKATALYPEVAGTSPRRSWFGWTPKQSAVDDESMVKSVLGAAASAMEASPSSPARSLRSTGSDSGATAAEAEATPAAAEAEATPVASMSQENSYLKGIDFGSELSPRARKASASLSATKRSLSQDSRNYLASFSWDDDAPSTAASTPQETLPGGRVSTEAPSSVPVPKAAKPTNALLSWLGGASGKRSAQSEAAKPPALAPAAAQNSYLVDLQ